MSDKIDVEMKTYTLHCNMYKALRLDVTSIPLAWVLVHYMNITVNILHSRENLASIKLEEKGQNLILIW